MRAKVPPIGYVQLEMVNGNVELNADFFAPSFVNLSSHSTPSYSGLSSRIFCSFVLPVTENSNSRFSSRLRRGAVLSLSTLQSLTFIHIRSFLEGVPRFDALNPSLCSAFVSPPDLRLQVTDYLIFQLRLEVTGNERTFADSNVEALYHAAGSENPIVVAFLLY